MPFGGSSSFPEKFPDFLHEGRHLLFANVHFFPGMKGSCLKSVSLSDEQGKGFERSSFFFPEKPDFQLGCLHRGSTLRRCGEVIEHPERPQALHHGPRRFLPPIGIGRSRPLVFSGQTPNGDGAAAKGNFGPSRRIVRKRENTPVNPRRGGSGKLPEDLANG